MRSDQPVINTYNRFEEFNNPELFEEEMHEMHCPTVPKAMTSDKDFEKIRVKKSKRKVKSTKAKIPTNDNFEVSSCKKIDQVIEEMNNVSDALIESVETDENKVRKSRDLKFVRRTPVIKLKMKSYSLRTFEDQNCFSILENNGEEDIDKIIDERLNIIKMKKALLKKCKSCNFKRRSCMLDRSSCPALKKTCFACKKDGHYPKSVNCKISRMNKRSKTPISICEEQPPMKSEEISATNMLLIKERIHQIETCNQGEESSFNQSEDQTQRHVRCENRESTVNEKEEKVFS